MAFYSRTLMDSRHNVIPVGLQQIGAGVRGIEDMQSLQIISLNIWKSLLHELKGLQNISLPILTISCNIVPWEFLEVGGLKPLVVTIDCPHHSGPRLLEHLQQWARTKSIKKTLKKVQWCIHPVGGADEQETLGLSSLHPSFLYCM